MAVPTTDEKTLPDAHLSEDRKPRPGITRTHIAVAKTRRGVRTSKDLMSGKGEPIQSTPTRPGGVSALGRTHLTRTMSMALAMTIMAGGRVEAVRSIVQSIVSNRHMATRDLMK